VEWDFRGGIDYSGGHSEDCGDQRREGENGRVQPEVHRSNVDVWGRTLALFVREGL